MAFIKEKERKSLVAKINGSYGFRKFLIVIEILALIGFIVVVFLQGTGKITQTYTDADKKLTAFGIGMLVYAIIIAVLGIIALILTLTLKSPKKIKADINKLQSSALSGKKVSKSASSQDVNRSRTTIKEK